MAPILYMFPPSPPVRSVLLCAKALGLHLEHKTVNLLKGEHFTEDYLKINPQHTIPTLDDDGFILWESHAIMPYLVGKYGKSKALYPENLKKRAVIDQRLHFNSNFLFARGGAMARIILFEGGNEVPESLKKAYLEGCDLLEKFLENMKFVAGDELSIADFSIVTTVNSTSAFVPLDASKYPRIASWMKSMEKLPYYDEANKKKILFEGGNEVPEPLKKAFLEGYDLLEKFLKNTKFVAGDELSIADFAIVTAVNSYSTFVPLDATKYPRIASWMKTMEKLPYYDEANRKGLEMFRSMVASKLSQ